MGFDSGLGRVVITHSTYVEGLIPWLKSLAGEKGIQTITPAVINRVRGRSQSLQLRVSTTIRGGYKLVARKGSSVQEVFIVTNLEESQLQSALERHRPWVQSRVVKRLSDKGEPPCRVTDCGRPGVNQKGSQSGASFPATRPVYVTVTTASPSRKRVRSEH